MSGFDFRLILFVCFTSHEGINELIDISVDSLMDYLETDTALVSSVMQLFNFGFQSI
jgi:hypothetical protein